MNPAAVIAGASSAARKTRLRPAHAAESADCCRFARASLATNRVPACRASDERLNAHHRRISACAARVPAEKRVATRAGQSDSGRGAASDRGRSFARFVVPRRPERTRRSWPARQPSWPTIPLDDVVDLDRPGAQPAMPVRHAHVNHQPVLGTIPSATAASRHKTAVPADHRSN